MVYIQLGSSRSVTWSIDVWTNLEVIRTDPNGTILPARLHPAPVFPFSHFPPFHQCGSCKDPRMLGGDLATEGSCYIGV
jgi:hypothetical protein